MGSNFNFQAEQEVEYTPNSLPEQAGEVGLQKAELMNYFNLGLEIDSDTDEKLNFIIENTENINDIIRLDVMLGQTGDKLTRMYTKLFLDKQESDYLEKLRLINMQKNVLRQSN